MAPPHLGRASQRLLYICQAAALRAALTCPNQPCAAQHATVAPCPVACRYVKLVGPEVNLFVDHSQVVQLECLRRGIWGTKSLWGRVLAYKGAPPGAASSGGTIPSTEMP